MAEPPDDERASFSKKIIDQLARGISGPADDLLMVALRKRFMEPTGPEHAVDDMERLMAAYAFYSDEKNRAAFLAEPKATEPWVAERRPWKSRGTRESAERVDMRMHSYYEAVWPEIRAQYASFVGNRIAHIRLFRHLEPRQDGAPRPLILCVHGYAGGSFLIEERSFMVRNLFDQGADVALFVLPFHGARMERDADKLPRWPQVDIGITNEGFGHTLADLRAFIAWVQKNDPTRPLVLCGMSLGAYVAALLATIIKVDALALLIPVAAFSDVMWHHGKGSAQRTRLERQGVTLEQVAAAMSLHASLSYEPKVRGERVLVIAGDRDKVAPPEHAARLAAHFDTTVTHVPGGHLLQVARGDAFALLIARLEKLKLL